MTNQDILIGELTENFDRKPFSFKHSLAHHPLFAQDKLIELAESLAEGRRLVYAADVAKSQVECTPAGHSLTIAETIRRIGELKTWVGLKMITCHPEYRALVDEILDPIQPLIEATHPGMHDREAHLVISSPHSVTPFHMDSEHIFFFHLRGRKEFTVFDQADRELVTDEERERHYTRVNRRMELPARLAESGKPFMLESGDAIHVPVLAPHLVRTFEDVCLSMTVTFRTREKDRRAMLYRVNHQLRARGFRPNPPGLRPWADTAKLALFNAQRRLRHGGRLPADVSGY